MVQDNSDWQVTARTIFDCWRGGGALDELPPSFTPATAEQGYQAQAALALLWDEPVVGWKIAATSAAGRAHINVDSPLAGRLYQSNVFADGARIALGANRMAMAEAEIVLTLGVDLVPRTQPYTEAEVADAVATVHPGLEIPDSRFSDFTRVGAASLIADNACAGYFVLGDAAPGAVNTAALAGCATELLINGEPVSQGQGADAMGGPLAALAWIANTLSALGQTLHAGQFVTTGVTGAPTPVRPQDTVTTNLGALGSVSATLVAGQPDQPPYGRGDTSFKAAGGEAGILQLIQAFYQIMGDNARTRRLIEMHPDDIEVSIDKLSRFLCGWLGGPKRYQEKYGMIRLPMAHQHLPVTEQDKENWLWCMQRALDRQPYAPGFKAYLMRELRRPAERIVVVCANSGRAAG